MVKYDFDTRMNKKFPVMVFRLNSKEYDSFIKYYNKNKMKVSEVIRQCLAKEKVI